jgi:hypothetical protein
MHVQSKRYVAKRSLMEGPSVKSPKRTAVNQRTRTGLVLFDLVMKTGELAAASAQTIHHRTQRMARAGLNSSARDRKEFLLMGQEKLEAAVESTARMATEAVALNQRLAHMMFKQMQAQAWALSGAAYRTPYDWMKAYTQLIQGGSLTQSRAVGASLVRSAAAGLKPVHSRARANAKRLGHRKKR